MNWVEAFGRALKAVCAVIVIYLIGGIFIFLGVRNIAENQYSTSDTADIVGAIFIMFGLLLIALGVIAVSIKILTDAIAHHVMRPLNEQIEYLASRNRVEPY